MTHTYESYGTPEVQNAYHMIKLAKSSLDNIASLVFTLRNHFLVKVFYFSRGKSLKISHDF